jgi:uncharacterized membrane protein HdeD (DUF308 family)
MRSSSKSRSGLELAYILSRNWLVLLLRGLIAIVFGVLALLLTKPGVSPLIWPFIIYALADGMLGVGIVLGEPAGRGSWLALFLWGLSGVGIAVLTYSARPRSRLEFMWDIAIWAFATGVLEIVTAIRLRRKLGAEWLLVIAGLMSVVFGVSIIELSGAGVFVLSRIIAAYSFTFGILLGVLGLRARTASMPSP